MDSVQPGQIYLSLKNALDNSRKRQSFHKWKQDSNRQPDLAKLQRKGLEELNKIHDRKDIPSHSYLQALVDQLMLFDNDRSSAGSKESGEIISKFQPTGEGEKSFGTEKFDDKLAFLNHVVKKC